MISDLDEVEGRPPVLNGVPALLAAERTPLKAARGPAFFFGDSPPSSAMASAEILRESLNVRTVPELAWIRAATPAERPLSVARNTRGEVIAVCHSARATAAAAEAGVETAHSYRGRGLAGAVVLAWAEAERAEGRLPLFSTQWANHASRAVAGKLGLVLYGEDYSIG